MQSSRGFGNHGYGKLRAMRLSRDVGVLHTTEEGEPEIIPPSVSPCIHAVDSLLIREVPTRWFCDISHDTECDGPCAHVHLLPTHTFGTSDATPDQQGEEVQFVIVLLYSMHMFNPSCKMPTIIPYIFVSNVLLVFYLFYDFYQKAYKSKKKD
uniref:Very-long-chain 3-oxoacyl-CoA synthase n=1 Tax=Timema bartmani TaxID=61472 RepID=A0A7R9I2H1_9NEOP|nr:unnamed protein product [Timema bartmani]